MPDLTLAEFLLARVAGDDERARAATCGCGGPACTIELSWYHKGEAVARLESASRAAHVLTWSPARVLSECEAKRRIVETLCGGMPEAAIVDGYEIDGWTAARDATLRLFALPYADHPDYREEWRP